MSKIIRQLRVASEAKPRKRQCSPIPRNSSLITAAHHGSKGLLDEDDEETPSPYDLNYAPGFRL